MVRKKDKRCTHSISYSYVVINMNNSVTMEHFKKEFQQISFIEIQCILVDGTLDWQI